MNGRSAVSNIHHDHSQKLIISAAGRIANDDVLVVSKFFFLFTRIVKLLNS